MPWWANINDLIPVTTNIILARNSTIIGKLLICNYWNLNDKYWGGINNPDTCSTVQPLDFSIVSPWAFSHCWPSLTMRVLNAHPLLFPCLATVLTTKHTQLRLGKGLVRVRGRSDDGQVVRWMSGACQVNVNSQSELDIGGRETCYFFTTYQKNYEIKANLHPFIKLR